MDDVQVENFVKAIYRVANIIEQGPYMHELLEVLTNIGIELSVRNRIEIVNMMHYSDVPQLVIDRLRAAGIPEGYLPQR